MVKNYFRNSLLIALVLLSLMSTIREVESAIDIDELFSKLSYEEKWFVCLYIFYFASI